VVSGLYFSIVHVPKLPVDSSFNSSWAMEDCRACQHDSFCVIGGTNFIMEKAMVVVLVLGLHRRFSRWF
jgi:hypothetical protein